MNWLFWTLIAWMAVAVIARIYMIGKPRKPLTSGEAALGVAIDIVVVVLLIVGWPK